MYNHLLTIEEVRNGFIVSLPQQNVAMGLPQEVMDSFDEMMGRASEIISPQDPKLKKDKKSKSQQKNKTQNYNNNVILFMSLAEMISFLERYYEPPISTLPFRDS